LRDGADRRRARTDVPVAHDGRIPARPPGRHWAGADHRSWFRQPWLAWHHHSGRRLASAGLARRGTRRSRTDRSLDTSGRNVASTLTDPGPLSLLVTNPPRARPPHAAFERFSAGGPAPPDRDLTLTPRITVAGSGRLPRRPSPQSDVDHRQATSLIAGTRRSPSAAVRAVSRIHRGAAGDHSLG